MAYCTVQILTIFLASKNSSGEFCSRPKDKLQKGMGPTRLMSRAWYCSVIIKVIPALQSSFSGKGRNSNSEIYSFICPASGGFVSGCVSETLLCRTKLMRQGTLVFATGSCSQMQAFLQMEDLRSGRAFQASLPHHLEKLVGHQLLLIPRLLVSRIP